LRFVLRSACLLPVLLRLRLRLLVLLRLGLALLRLLTLLGLLLGLFLLSLLLLGLLVLLRLALALLRLLALLSLLLLDRFLLSLLLGLLVLLRLALALLRLLLLGLFLLSLVLLRPLLRLLLGEDDEVRLAAVVVDLHQHGVRPLEVAQASLAIAEILLGGGEKIRDPTPHHRIRLSLLHRGAETVVNRAAVRVPSNGLLAPATTLLGERRGGRQREAGCGGRQERPRQHRSISVPDDNVFH
jgi:hypothetical protein